MWYQVKQALDQSTRLFLTRLASLLPGIVALIVALLVALILAAVIAVVVRRLLVRMSFDERLVQWGFASVSLWSPLKSPALLVSRVLAALVIFCGFLIGLAAFDPELTSLLARTVFAYIPNIVGALDRAGCWQPHRQISRAKRADRRRQHELSIRTLAQRGREVAGDCAHSGDGSGTSAHQRRHCGAGLRHPVRRGGPRICVDHWLEFQGAAGQIA